MAASWFPHHESTLAIMLTAAGGNISIGLSNYLTPLFIQSPADIYKLSFMFGISGVILAVIVLSCITRSSPKMPPSSIAIMTASTEVPLKSGLRVMMTNPSYVLLLAALTINCSIVNATHVVLEDILRMQQYSNTFCGKLIAHRFFFSLFFMIMGAVWVDNSANYVKFGRISAVLCAVSTVAFNISIIIPNIKTVILVTNVMVAFGGSLMYPALFQMCLRGAATILPEATVAAITVIAQQLLAGILMNSFGPLKKMSPSPDGYQAPMIIFACVVMIVNFLYATSFRAPNRDELYARLGNSEDRAFLVEE